MRPGLRLPHGLAVALLLAMTACGRPATTGDSTPSPAQAPTTAVTAAGAAPPTAAAAAGGTPAPPLPSADSTSVDGSSSASQSIPPAAQQLVQQAVADAARRLGVASSAVAILNVTAMTWPNHQLGCGGADMGEETPTPGFRILLQVANRQLEYHADIQRVMWCDKRRS